MSNVDKPIGPINNKKKYHLKWRLIRIR